MKLNPIVSLLREFFRPAGAAVNTTSLPSTIQPVPGGLVADNVGMWGLIGMMANENAFNSNPLIAVPTTATTTPTLTAAQFLSPIIDFASTAGSGITLTTPTAAQIIAALPPTAPKGGFNFLQLVMNDNTGQTITYTAGANVTLSATTATIATNTSRFFLVNINVNAGTVTIVGIGGGMAL